MPQPSAPLPHAVRPLGPLQPRWNRLYRQRAVPARQDRGRWSRTWGGQDEREMRETSARRDLALLEGPAGL